MNPLRYRLRYWHGRICKFLGFCRDCRSTLNFTRSGVGVCPNCRKRF